MDGVYQAKQALARSTKRGFPVILSGLLFWLAAGGAAFFLPEEAIVWVYVFGVGVVFPLGILLARLMNIDLFAKGNPLGPLAGVIGAVQILFVPIVLMLVYYEPRWLPFVLGVLNGAHFLPYVWVYNSKTYLFHSVATTGIATVVGVAYMTSTFTVTPFAVAAVFVITLIGLWMESGKDGMQK